MKKPKIVFVIGWYLILVNILSMPTFIKNRIYYKVDMSSIEFAYLSIYWIMLCMLLSLVITGIGLILFQHWARILAIALSCIGIILGLISIMLNFYTKQESSIAFYVIGILIEIAIIYILCRPRIKNAF